MPQIRYTRGEGGGRKSKNNMAEKDLCDAFVALKDADEARRFLYDLCTPKEISDMSERLWIARLLSKGEGSYRDIHAMTGVSVTTIGRVARFLEQENYKGYEMILKRLGK